MTLGDAFGVASLSAKHNKFGADFFHDKNVVKPDYAAIPRPRLLCELI